MTPVKDPAAFKGQPRLDGGSRYRSHVVLSDQSFYDLHLAENLAHWELARRYGRSQTVTATVSLWRDSAGTLWAPNTLAQVDMPALKLAGLTWLISQVVYMQGLGTGTRAVVTLMPKEAFEPQPSFDTPFDPQVSAAQADALKRQLGSVAGDGRRASVTQGAGI